MEKYSSADILVCVRQTPDLDMVLSADWVLDSSGAFNIDYANRVIDSFDETAVELALRFTERCGGCVQALTVGGPASERMLRGLYALGAVDPVRIESKGIAHFSPAATAARIAEYLGTTGLPGFILTGLVSGEENNAVTPQYLAAMLGIPCVTNVTAIEDRSSDGRFYVQRTFEKQIQTISVQGPFVASIGNISGILLRTATLKAVLEAKKIPIRTVRVPATEPPFGKKRFVRFLNHTGERQCQMLSQGDAALMAKEAAKEIVCAIRAL